MDLRSQHELKCLFFVTVLSVLLIPVTVCVATEQIPLEEQLPLHVDILQVLARANQSEEGVDLNALKSLDVNAARVIAETRGKLFLNGLTAITPEVAEVLGTHRGMAASRRLAVHESGSCDRALKASRLALSEWIKVLDKDVALALLPYRGQLYLDSVQTITDEVAEIIAQRRNGVELYGVQDINYQSVAMLRKNSEIILPAKFNRAGWWPF